jgi:aryl sulfotransferase
MRRLAAVLGVEVADERWGELVAAVGFDAMRADANRWAPDRLGVLRDRTRFFRLGRSGSGRSLLGPDELDRYAARIAALAPADLLAWLHRDRLTAPR